nr:MAG TPA: hypothetical protein [Caudoviricetes sp.]
MGSTEKPSKALWKKLFLKKLIELLIGLFMKPIWILL